MHAEDRHFKILITFALHHSLVSQSLGTSDYEFKESNNTICLGNEISRKMLSNDVSTVVILIWYIDWNSNT
jgi:hypothetical protein